MTERKPMMNRLFVLLCYLTRTDPEIIQQCHRFDRMTMIAEAMALLLVGVITVGLWTVFFDLFFPLLTALPMALLVGAFLVLLEGMFAASDWHLRGVLAQKKSVAERLSGVAMIALRLGIALVFAWFTSKAATMALYDATIRNQMAAIRVAANEPVERQYAERLRELSAGLTQPIARGIEKTSAELATETARQDALRRDAAAARSQADRAQIEIGRELDGLERARGEGPRYRDAVRQQEIATRNQRLAEADLDQVLARKAVLEAELGRLTGMQKQATAELESGRQRLHEELRRDPRWKPEGDDPILRLQALQSVKRDPANAAVIQMFDVGLMALLVILELGFFLGRFFFAPASVYVVRLTARTQIDALKVTLEYERQIAELQAQRRRSQLHAVESPRAGERVDKVLDVG